MAKKRYRVVKSFRIAQNGQLGLNRNFNGSVGLELDLDAGATDVEKYVKSGHLALVGDVEVDEDRPTKKK